MTRAFALVAILAASIWMQNPERSHAAPAEAARSTQDMAFTSIDSDPLRISDFAGSAVLLVDTTALLSFTHQYGRHHKRLRTSTVLTP
ncbi:MAG: hypothetical protein AAGA21_12705 [Pseudomonadota bacterium]